MAEFVCLSQKPLTKLCGQGGTVPPSPRPGPADKSSRNRTDCYLPIPQPTLHPLHNRRPSSQKPLSSRGAAAQQLSGEHLARLRTWGRQSALGRPLRGLKMRGGGQLWAPQGRAFRPQDKSCMPTRMSDRGRTLLNRPVLSLLRKRHPRRSGLVRVTRYQHWICQAPMR